MPPIPLNSTGAATTPITQPIPNGNTRMAAMSAGSKLSWIVGDLQSDLSTTNFALYQSTDGLVGAVDARIATGPSFYIGYNYFILGQTVAYFAYLDFATSNLMVGSVDLIAGTFWYSFR